MVVACGSKRKLVSLVSCLCSSQLVNHTELWRTTRERYARFGFVINSARDLIMAAVSSPTGRIHSAGRLKPYYEVTDINAVTRKGQKEENVLCRYRGGVPSMSI